MSTIILKLHCGQVMFIIVSILTPFFRLLTPKTQTPQRPSRPPSPPSTPPSTCLVFHLNCLVFSQGPGLGLYYPGRCNHFSHHMRNLDGACATCTEEWILTERIKRIRLRKPATQKSKKRTTHVSIRMFASGLRIDMVSTWFP